ncbi:MAG: hypothetical protein H6Q69_2693 [Firmicutes bacterium]|nr:hypothetical protein [Bacillota bacterium]
MGISLFSLYLHMAHEKYFTSIRVLNGIQYKQEE